MACSLYVEWGTARIWSAPGREVVVVWVMWCRERHGNYFVYFSERFFCWSRGLVGEGAGCVRGWSGVLRGRDLR